MPGLFVCFDVLPLFFLPFNFVMLVIYQMIELYRSVNRDHGMTAVSISIDICH